MQATDRIATREVFERQRFRQRKRGGEQERCSDRVRVPQEAAHGYGRWHKLFSRDAGSGVRKRRNLAVVNQQKSMAH